jgi:TolB-like protein
MNTREIVRGAMRKQIFVSVVLTLLLVSTIIAQKSKSKNEPQPSPTPQVSLEQRLGELSKDISDELTHKQKTTVAIADFVDLNGNTSDFGKFLAEELVTRLYKTKKLKVIERQRLDKVIAEQKLSLTEIIEVSSAKRIGRILGVDAIVAGTISELGNSFRINARIINTETGELLAAAGATIIKDQEVCSLINCGAKTTVAVLPITSPTPKPATSQTWKRESNFYSFELKKCKASGPSVVCDFIVTNTDQNRWLAIHLDSKMFDNFSNQSNASRISLGNEESSSWGWAKKFLIGDIQIPTRIVFNNVSTDATKIVLLRIHCDTSGSSDSDSNYTHFNIEFKNIPLRE